MAASRVEMATWSETISRDAMGLCLIYYAQAQDASFVDERYAQHNPCTTVYKLVRLLRGEDKEFNKRILSDLGEK
jgi:hypothetical protein